MKEKLKIPNIEQIEKHEQDVNHFAKGLNFHKLSWFFMIGSFLGVIAEMLWCICTRFRLESRVGLIYGPFNLVYGFGAIGMALGLHWLRKKRKLYIFLGGVIIGTIVEYICSIVQEYFFGSVSWDYSGFPLNLNGRVILWYSFIWGFLAIFWIKCIYPFFANLLLKIPNKVGKILTWVFVVFMIFNTIMSILAMHRWIMRRDKITHTSGLIWEYFDIRFPNDKMQELFPNMVFIKEDIQS